MPVQATPPIETLTRTLLDAYSKSDATTVLSLVDPDNITIYGSDVAEFVHGREAVSTMLANDARLWQNSAHIGPMEHISTVYSGDVATIFFDAPFTVGGHPPVPIRVALVWQRHGRRWLLRQASNVVPTTGQSASELLSQH